MEQSHVWSDLTFGWSDLSGIHPTMVRSNRNSDLIALKSFFRVLNAFQMHLTIILILFIQQSQNEVIKTSCSVHFVYTCLQAKKFLQCDWLKRAVFNPNLKYLHAKITVSMTTELILKQWRKDFPKATTKN